MHLALEYNADCTFAYSWVNIFMSEILYLSLLLHCHSVFNLFYARLYNTNITILLATIYIRAYRSKNMQIINLCVSKIIIYLCWQHEFEDTFSSVFKYYRVYKKTPSQMGNFLKLRYSAKFGIFCVTKAN
jgi:hypothetical protein